MLCRFQSLKFYITSKYTQLFVYRDTYARAHGCQTKTPTQESFRQGRNPYLASVSNIISGKISLSSTCP